jgi:hypothetical protein
MRLLNLETGGEEATVSSQRNLIGELGGKNLSTVRLGSACCKSTSRGV